MKNSNTIYLLGGALVTASVLAALTLQAQDDSTSPRTEGRTARGQAQVNQQQMTASSFIKEASQGNMAEIALADTAIAKSQNAEVKEFAEHVKKDHTAANQKLQQIAQEKNITLDQELDAKYKQKQTALEQKSGEEFDKEFATLMLKDHAKGIPKYQQAAKLDDAEVKAYAQDTLPKLQTHMQHGKEVAKTVGVDQATISSYTTGLPESVGGTVDKTESESGKVKRDEETKP
jgi:putative membrane protein